MPSSADRYSAYSEPEQEGPGTVGILAFLLAFAVPGIGHMLIGQWRRGLVFAITIHLLFAAGMFIAGIRAINPPDQQLWTYTQYLAGWPMYVAHSIEKQTPNARAINEEFERRYHRDSGQSLHDNRVLDERKKNAEVFMAEFPLFAYHPKVQDMGAVYCGIAGMLNLLVIFDVLLRITGSTRPDPNARHRPATPPAPVAPPLEARP